MNQKNLKNRSSGGINFPKIRCIQQNIATPSIKNIKASLKKKLDNYGLKSFIDAGDSVALTASSRGINNQALILKILIKYLKNLDAKPFVIPAMGSHGGATAAGQLRILKEYNITEKTLGCPIKASMEVVKLGDSDLGFAVYLDKQAALADKIIVINKIKTHSKFVGKIESGLCKMCLMGLGKHKGAKLYHQLIEHYSWPKILESIIKVVIKKAPIICGIGLVQNSQNQIAEIHILHPDEFFPKEPGLLERYKTLMGKIPFKDIDLLIVDEMGKNIFGTGMDTTITGRKPSSPMNVQWLFVRDLTEETHGNAQGIGLADFTTKRLVDKINFSETYMNALTAYRTDSPKIPIYLSNDYQILKKISNLANMEDPLQFRLIWIKNTLDLSRMFASEYFFKQVESQENLTFIGMPESLEFDSDGFLTNSKKYW
jgi:hypothetical protein